MPRTVFLAVVLAFLPPAGPLSHAESPVRAPWAPDALDQWGQWRGPLGTGIAPRADPPVEWGEGRNVRWKTAIPGKGHSTPVVWGDRVFLTTEVPHGEALAPQEGHAPGAHDHRIQPDQHINAGLQEEIEQRHVARRVDVAELRPTGVIQLDFRLQAGQQILPVERG